MAVFSSLDLLRDRTPRDGAEQMALDEALLETAPGPILRSYRWAGDWASFGYAQSYETVRRESPAQHLVRRWTGGGIVEHRHDWTFSLIVPREDSFAQLRPAESYSQIHRAVAAALASLGRESRLAGRPADGPSAPRACFAGQPAACDVLDREGQKLCGGAQRRTRHGFLHQGSLQNVAVQEDFLLRLGAALAETTRDFSLTPEILSRAAALAAGKYASPDWTHRLP